MNTTVFNKNEMRTFPIKDEFLGDKRLNDIIYGFLQANSFFDSEQKKRYCWKADTNAAKIYKYFSEQEMKSPASERTIRTMISLFDTCGLLEAGSLNGKKVYFLKDLEKGKYIYIKTETLRFLVNTASSNVIKVYAFLKAKQQQHIDFRYAEPYRFSKAKLLEVLGYTSQNNGQTLKMIGDILDNLQNNGLIRIHKEWIHTGNDNAAEYYVLDDVNDDYKHNDSRKSKDDNGYCAVPLTFDVLKTLSKEDDEPRTFTF